MFPFDWCLVLGIILDSPINYSLFNYRSKRDGIEANVKQEEANIVNLTRELSQAKVQRKVQGNLHQEAINTAQNFSVSLSFTLRK